MKVWMFLSFAGYRQYGGNLGYQDDPRTIYRYDNFVGNHLKVKPGHLAVVCERAGAQGVAKIEDVYEQPGFKTQQRCPQCGITGIKARHSLKPLFRCNNGHTFDLPDVHDVPCLLYEAHFGGSFEEPTHPMSLTEVRGFLLRPSAQLAIQELDIAILDKMLPHRSEALKEETENHEKSHAYVLKLKDGSDVQGIRSQAFYTMVRKHNQMTNALLSMCGRHEKKAIEGNKQEALFDCLVIDYLRNGRDLLIEAKPDIEIPSVRLAVGQLMDYRRFVPRPQQTDAAVLLHARPGEHVVRLLADLNIVLLYFSRADLSAIGGDLRFSETHWSAS